MGPHRDMAFNRQGNTRLGRESEFELESTQSTAAIVQVEPDSWGFMIWTMGVNGNADATSVPVKVESSGHPDVAGLTNPSSPSIARAHC